MFLDTDLTQVTVLLLGAGKDSRSARRLRAAGATVHAVETAPPGEEDVQPDPVPGNRWRPGLVLVVGDCARWDRTVTALRAEHGSLPVAEVPAERAGVSLVGGGPGAADLVTARGLAAVGDADVVLLDRLAPQDVVERQAPHAEVVRVGKWPGHHPVPQEQIQSILLNSAQEGRHVVRLKGGDPYVFGRGGEEAADCESWGVPVDVVPGITSAISVPGAAGIPVTFRDVSRTFTVASGHVPFSEAELDGFCDLLGTGATLVVLMGVATLPQLVAGLTRHGAAVDTPIALVEKGFSAEQKTYTSVLGSAVTDLAAAGSPAVTVIGPVAALASEDRERILGELTPHRAVAHRGPAPAPEDPMTSNTANDHGTDARTDDETGNGADGAQSHPQGPLSGRTVAVTAHRRADDQIGALERKGATVIAAPSLKLVPVEEDAAVVSETRDLLAVHPDLIVVTTGYGFKRWWEVVQASGQADGVHAMLATADIWVRGPKGRAAVRNLGLHDVGISPDETIGPLVDEILESYDHDLTGAVIGWQENGYHDREQRQRLMDAGATVHTVVPHRWADADDAGVLPGLIRQICAREIDAVTFTSAAGAESLLSTASELGVEREFVAAFSPADTEPGSQGEAPRTVVAATVGPVTAAPLQRAGVPALVPERFRMGAMINQLAETLGGR
ncbi:uroporphyrinogen-III C-methyltransferase [Kocuria soli]|uniref:uroporphyrinogen-III C-methyltransferase n=1 Tax=Kocuria soli TaxID=2485125 RepID=A0A3N3ZT93_9MICC|nr:uroporphyrinogen-III C-methyltransferase [Kocuria soli]ROZ63286.1 uroporphyrinogen-III C-methyltransferase [Kocuria soli]